MKVPSSILVVAWAMTTSCSSAPSNELGDPPDSTGSSMEVVDPTASISPSTSSGPESISTTTSTFVSSFTPESNDRSSVPAKSTPRISALPPSSPPQASPIEIPNHRGFETGLTSLFLGHSFFQPPAFRLDALARKSGLSSHQQTIVTGGGSSGAPEALWNNAEKRDEALTVLKSGQIELLGMTYHPDYPTLTGYRLWIDEALLHNPNTAFFVGMPWLLDPTSMTSTEYSRSWKVAYADTVASIVRRLQVDYPAETIFAIPYGRSAADLYEEFELGRLAQITALVGDPQTSLSRDEMGHAGQIVEELASLVWLKAIYCVDLNNFAYPSKYEVDLRVLGTTIVEEDDPQLRAPWCLVD